MTANRPHHAFDRVCDRYPTPSIGYAITPAITPSITCDRVCDRLCLIPSNSYGDRSARRGLGRWRHDPPKGRGRRDLVTANTQITRESIAVAVVCQPIASDHRHITPNFSPAAFDNKLANGYPGPAAADFAHTVPTRRPDNHVTPVTLGLSGHRPRDGKSRDEGFRRAVAAYQTLIGGEGAHARDPSAGQVLGDMRALAISRPRSPDRPCRKTPGGVGGGPNLLPRPIADVFLVFRGFSRKNCCLSATKTGLQNFGGAVPKNPVRP
jgi:hypothetical protein